MGFIHKYIETKRVLLTQDSSKFPN